MKEKKESKDWYIAAMHYLTAGFAIPFLIMLVLSIPMVLIFGANTRALVVAVSIVMLLTVWLGVLYSAKFLAKTYIIKDKDNIIKLATIYLVVIAIFFRVKELVEGVSFESVSNFVFFIANAVVFYVASKKYVKNTEEVSTTQESGQVQENNQEQSQESSSGERQ